MNKVVAADHPDCAGGIVWSACELRWINAKLEQQAKRIKERDHSLSQALHERDSAEACGTALAESVGEHFRVYVGEHSNMNNPLEIATAILDGEYITDSDKDRQLATANALIEQARPVIERLSEEVSDDYACHVQEGGNPTGYSASEQEILSLAAAIERHKGEKS